MWWYAVIRSYVVMGCDGCQSDPFQWRSILHSRCLSFIKPCRIFLQKQSSQLRRLCLHFPLLFMVLRAIPFLFDIINLPLRRDVALPSLLKKTPGCSDADGHSVAATVEAISGLGEVIDEQLSELLLEELGIPSYGWWFGWVLSFLPKIMVFFLQNKSHLESFQDNCLVILHCKILVLSYVIMGRGLTIHNDCKHFFVLPTKTNLLDRAIRRT